MPILNITENYSDENVLFQAQLNQAMQSIETFLNTTKLDSTNIQTGGIISANLASSSVATGAIAAAAVTLAKLASEVTERLNPAGAILPYGGSTPPSGYVLCDGSAISRTAFSALFSAVGVRFGQGDGSTTFNVPDLRGRFLRGRDAGTGRDPDAGSRTAMATGGASGDNVGSIQSDAFESHDHGGGDHTHGVPANDGTTSANAAGNLYTRQNTAGTSAASGDIIDAEGGNETRPINAYVNFIIKT